jgi:hypothetical protein
LRQNCERSVYANLALLYVAFYANINFLIFDEHLNKSKLKSTWKAALKSTQEEFNLNGLDATKFWTLFFALIRLSCMHTLEIFLGAELHIFLYTKCGFRYLIIHETLRSSSTRLRFCYLGVKSNSSMQMLDICFVCAVWCIIEEIFQFFTWAKGCFGDLFFIAFLIINLKI